MNSTVLVLLTITSTLFFTACSESVPQEVGANEQGHIAPTNTTIAANQAFLDKRPFSNTSDFEYANKGFIARDESFTVKAPNNDVVFSVTDFDFIHEKGSQAPSSVNPSLWRQATLNSIHGLFQVTEGIYQIRGADLSNMSIIEGQTGWILVDPLTSVESAREAFLLAQQHLDKKPVVAVLFTHSHVDHFAGIKGIRELLSEEENENLRIFAPEGFVEEATSENIIAGIAMGRRAGMMYGTRLAKNERGHIDSGLGKMPVVATLSFEVPTDLVSYHNLEQTIDGVPFVFQMVSGSEAPAEFTFYLPTYKAFCGAELVSRNMHNLYTLRGAKVRDANVWVNYIEEARTRFADANVFFGSHHWPLWGQENINDFLEKQRDTYKFIHDQTVRLMNHGYTPREIANTLELPEALTQDFHNQGYYGTVAHNSKAVYQFYLGWYNANPATLHPLAETETAKRYVAMMGGLDQLLERAQIQFEAASKASAEMGSIEYRWLAELLNHAVFAEPSNTEAKSLLAKVYDQLGYQAESGPWRDVYLSASYELRHGGPEKGLGPAKMKETLLETPINLFLDSMAVRLNSEKADGEELTINLTFSDLNESHLITVKNSVMHHKQLSNIQTADVSLNLTFTLFVDIAIGKASLKDLLLGDELDVEGSAIDLIRFISMIDKTEGTFNIIEP